MSFCTSDITLLAGQIYSGIDAPSSQSVGYVSGWLTSESTLGELNTRLSTCFGLSGVEPCITNGFGWTEANILSLTYTTNYYQKRALQVLAAGGLQWLTLKEGDSSLSRVSPVLFAAEWRKLHEAAQAELYVAVANYNMDHARALSVDAEALPSWPTP